MEQPKDKERVPLLPVGGGLPEPAKSSSQVFKLPIFDIRVSVDAALRIGVCVLLCMQNSAYTLSRRYGSGVLKEAASSQSILAVGEIMKLVFSIVMIRRQQAGGAEVGGAESLAGATRRLVTSSLPMAVPALIFLAMNLLSFVALRRISASAFTLIQQGKIVATAMLSRFLLGKLISPARWRALCTLLCAVLIICHQTHPQTVQACGTEDAAPSGAVGAGGAQSPAADEAERLATEAYSEYAIGVAAVAVEAGLSGLSNVYFEKVRSGGRARGSGGRARGSSELVLLVLVLLLVGAAAAVAAVLTYVLTHSPSRRRSARAWLPSYHPFIGAQVDAAQPLGAQRTASCLLALHLLTVGRRGSGRQHSARMVGPSPTPYPLEP